MTTRTVSAPPSSGGDDFALLNNFLATVPDGSVIQFPNSVYRLSQGVMLGNRNNLVFKLGTAEFRLTGDGSSHLSSAFIPGFSYQSRSFTSGGSHLAFEGGKVVGNDSCPGCPQPLRGENQQAVRANNATFVEISGMTVDKVSGDGAFFDGGSDIWVHDTHVINAGRNGFTLIKGQRVLVERNTYDRVGYCTFDLEPNYASEASSDMTFRDNTAGSWGLDWVSVDGGARGADIRRVTVSGNTTTGTALDLHIDNKGGTNGTVGALMHDIAVTNNRSAVAASGPRLYFAHIDGLTVTGNVQPLSSGTLASITASTAVTYR